MVEFINRVDFCWNVFVGLMTNRLTGPWYRVRIVVGSFP